MRYCTLNNLRGSVHTPSTEKPALAASCANSSSVYLYELSVQMLSPSLKEISLSPMRTADFHYDPSRDKQPPNPVRVLSEAQIQILIQFIRHWENYSTLP